ncbi:MAG TPA: LamG-like jellyroll fold domain-containing protein, partial [Candidatus Angelobacter sp.]|nr:LamG-like jellyroll fold domain-containing protein [Candidatus Angelobacter sp.]
WRLEHLPDFVQCGDPWFRPVSIHFGPDGCLYIVDWYNKIISHNEVPRNHPERDKTRGRIWRVRHESQTPRANVPNLYQASDSELLDHLNAANTWEVNAAWQEIVDRNAVSLAPKLAGIVTNDAQPNDLRIRALWCLEGLDKVELRELEKLATAPHRALRKEAFCVARRLLDRPSGISREQALALAKRGLEDRDRLVRQEVIRLLGQMLAGPTPASEVSQYQVVTQLLRAAVRMPPPQDAKWSPYFESYERYLVRLALEKNPSAVSVWFDARADTSNDLAARRAFAAVAMGGIEGAKRLAALLPQLKRGLSTEELLLVASVPTDPAANAALKAALAVPGTLRLLYDNRVRLPDHAALAPLLTDAIRAFLKNDPGEANQDLLVKLATGFHLTGLEDDLVAAATKPGASAERQLSGLRALRESGSARVDMFRRFATSGNTAVQREAVTALAGTKTDAAVPALLEVWPSLTPTLRKMAVDRLASSAAGAKQLVASVGSGAIARDELDGYTLDKLSIVLPDDPAVKKLAAEVGSELKPVLRLNGGDGDCVDTDLALHGPFTVECWAKLDPGINNQDSILAGPGALDANFHDGRFRVWVGGGVGDIVIATKPVAPEAWTHLAFTRDADGRFRLFQNGELDVTSRAVEKRDFEHLKVGLSNPAGGTAGEFAEFRVWNVCRSPDEIRASANVSMDRNSLTSALLYHGSGDSWGKLQGGAHIERTGDLPPILTEIEARALAAKFAQFRELANKSGDLTRGQQVFVSTCGVCHAVKGQGGKIGPVLDGAGANGIESLLRNVLTPNAAMEAGYRRFRVETRDGEVQEGLFVSQDDNSVVLRQPNTEDLRLPRGNIRRAGYTRLSIMPEGLIEGLKPEDVSDLFAFLKTLK